MRLEPVYLVAPKPKPPSMPHRRAFLIAGGTFLAGIGLGGACGYAVGATRSDTPGGADEPNLEPLLAPSGDSDLDELRRLAVKAPIEELMARSLLFLDLLSDTYRRDEALWHGAARICSELCSNSSLPKRRVTALWLAQVIDRSDADLAVAMRLRQHLHQLRQIK